MAQNKAQIARLQDLREQVARLTTQISWLEKALKDKTMDLRAKEDEIKGLEYRIQSLVAAPCQHHQRGNED